MKRFFSLLLLCAAMLAPLPAYASEKTECEAAADEIMAAICGWKQSEEASFLVDSEVTTPYLRMFGDAAEQLAARIGYRPGNGKVVDNTAVVDLAISAVDVGQATGKILLQAAGYLAVQRIYGGEPDLNAFVGAQLTGVIETLPTITTQTSVYLIRGGDGEWKLDLGDERNLDFLNALGGGGVLPYLDTLQGLMEAANRPPEP